MLLPYLQSKCFLGIGNEEMGVLMAYNFHIRLN